MKKIFIVFMAIFTFSFANVASYQKAHAFGGIFDFPSNIDEVAKGVFVAIGAAVVAVEHASSETMDNIQKVVDIGMETYNTWSPVAKKAFIDSVNFYGDNLTITADYLKDLYQGKLDGVTLSPEFKQFEYYNHGIRVPKNYSVEISILGKSFNMNSCNYDNCYFTVSASPGRYSTSISELHLRKQVGTSGSNQYWYSGEGDLTGVDGYSRDLANRVVDAQSKGAGLASFYETISILGGTITITNLATGAINTRDEVVVPDYSSDLSRRMNDAIDRGLNLGLSRPMATTDLGQPLTLDASGVYLDGIPYTGNINWAYETTKTGDAGVLVVPDIMIDGKPHKLVQTPTGEYIPVDANGKAATNTNGGEVVPYDIHYVDGVPYIKTATGEMINVVTGEVTPSDTVIDPVKPETGMWSNLWQWLKKILDAILAIPAKIIDLLKIALVALFVPTAGFWENNLNQLKGLLFGEQIDDTLKQLDGLQNAGGGMFQDMKVTIMGATGVIVDSSSINSVLNTIHKWVRGVFFPFLIFYNINSLYKMIRGTSLVEVTRAIRERNNE